MLPFPPSSSHGPATEEQRVDITALLLIHVLRLPSFHSISTSADHHTSSSSHSNIVSQHVYYPSTSLFSPSPPPSLHHPIAPSHTMFHLLTFLLIPLLTVYNMVSHPSHLTSIVSQTLFILPSPPPLPLSSPSFLLLSNVVSNPLSSYVSLNPTLLTAPPLPFSTI